eukprot:PhM_4_TR8164/c0_g1_i1/m.12160/K00966/GMPP; mannose-1-phosphate guanylyltransferase
MKALILVGGYGTRLRPLTFTKPKPLVPFCNKPIVVHQIEALKAVGVTQVILAIAYRPELMKAEMEQWAHELGVTIVYSHETTPMGTAGPLALAVDAGYLDPEDTEPFFVLNSDVTCMFPLRELLDSHKAHGKQGTILVKKVDDWKRYGVVVFHEGTGKIERFAEKPKEFVGDKINAGIYVFSPSMLKRIPMERTSIETQVFPAMAADGNLYALELKGYWMDIGQPNDFVDGMALYLAGLVEAGHKDMLAHTPTDKSYTIVGNVMIDPTAKIGSGSVIGPNVSIGRNCVVGNGVRVANTAIFENSVVGDSSYVAYTIVGWNNTIGRWCRLEHRTVLGDDIQVKDELHLNGAKVLPHKGINVSIEKPEVVM